MACPASMPYHRSKTQRYHESDKKQLNIIMNINMLAL